MSKIHSSQRIYQGSIKVKVSVKVSNQSIKASINYQGNPKAFIDYSQTTIDGYEYLEDHTPTKKRRVVMVFDNMIADIKDFKDFIKLYKDYTKVKNYIHFQGTIQLCHEIIRFFDPHDLIEFKDKLQLFCHYTIEINPNNEDQIKDLKERKVVLGKLLNYMIRF